MLLVEQILPSTERVVQRARHVRLDLERLRQKAREWTSRSFEPPGWNTEVHWAGANEETANAVLLLDALNFCFWPDPGQTKWSIEYGGRCWNGYNALAASLKRAIEEGLTLFRAETLVGLGLEDLERVFRGHGMIPMLDERLQHCHQIGRVLLEKWNGSFAEQVRAARGSAVTLAESIARDYPCFFDLAEYDGETVVLLKRAQITVIDLLGTFGGESLGHFEDASCLTAFADYKIPQVLEAHGIMVYDEELSAAVGARAMIAPGDPREVEIRAAMVWAVEHLRQAFVELGQPVEAYQLDWFLWNLGQEPVENEKPYHRTRTIFY